MNAPMQPQLDLDYSLVQGSVKKAMHAVEAKSRDLWQVSPQSLRVIPNFNVRVKDESYTEHIRTLADSMKANGFYQDKPLAGFVARENDENVIYVYDGHCRLEAALLAIQEGAEIIRIPVVVNADGMAMEDLTVALVRGNSGKPLSAFETAVVCKRLARFGWTTQEIAGRLQFSSQHVENLLLLVSAPVEIRQMVMENRISASTAIQALKDHGANALDILSQAEGQANAAGKTKVTARHIQPKPGQILAKAAKKVAPKMFETLVKVETDPAFLALSPEIRESISELLSALRSAEASIEPNEISTEAVDNVVEQTEESL